MKIIQTKLKDCYLIKPDVYEDDRGFFLKHIIKKYKKIHNFPENFVQDNHSRSKK